MKFGTSDQSCWLAEACKVLLLQCSLIANGKPAGQNHEGMPDSGLLDPWYSSSS